MAAASAGDEVVPTIDARVPDAAGFATTTLERFANPDLDHKLTSIALNTRPSSGSG